MLSLRAIDAVPWTAERWLLAFAVVGAVIGLGLTFVEIFLIQAICILCAVGVGFDLGILGLAAILPPQDYSASRSE